MARKFSSVRRRFWIALIITLCVMLVVFSLYLLRLDRSVQERFASVRWVLPAQVYAAPLEIYPGLTLSTSELDHQLDRLGYRRVTQLAGAGSYVTTRREIDIDTRPFTFWDGPQEPIGVKVQIADGTISSIQDIGSGKMQPLVRFDPQLIGSIYPSRGGEDRILVKLDQVPSLLPKTLILVEDRDFYSNIGISFRGIFRAAAADLMAGRIVQGASTLTQQLIKNLFLSDRRSFARKIKEALMSVLLERHVSKDQILQAYLNEVYLGQDGQRAVHGFGLASKFYFNKPLAELHPHEIAMLVAIVKGPSYYNPRRWPKRVLARRDLVLRMMQSTGYLTADQASQEIQAPLGVTADDTGGAGRYPAFIDLVKRQLQGQYSEQDLTLEGLRIFTTLDTRVQRQLEKHISKGLPKIERDHGIKSGTLQAAGVVTSVDNGEVLGVVGGRDSRYEGFNRALDSERQIGSMAKPFLYLAALEQPQRFNLGTLLADQPISIKLPNGTTWKPHNFEKTFGPPVPMYMALAKSMNVPTVNLGVQVGVEEVQKTFAQAGFDKAPALPSIFLGAVDMSPLEVAQTYSTIAGGGYLTPLQAIRAVMTEDGKPLQRYSLKIHQSLPAGPVYLITWAMENVMRIGTGRWSQSVLPAGTVLAGKTGTTDNFRDSWFAGFGANRVAVIWVGRDDNQPTRLQGATGALRIWAPLMRDLHVKSLDPTPPPSIELESIDPGTDQRAASGCPDAVTLPFIKGEAPAQYAPCANGSQSPPRDWFGKLFE